MLWTPNNILGMSERGIACYNVSRPQEREGTSTPSLWNLHYSNANVSMEIVKHLWSDSHSRIVAYCVILLLINM